MSLDLGFQSLDVKLTGSKAYVPENNLAKLMYYLNCVTGVIQYDENNKFLEYQKYYLLSEKEEQLVVIIAILFDPKILISQSLFLVGSEYVPSGKTNQFYELTNNKFGIHINSEVIIGGVARKVLKFMGCTQSWLDDNYYEPINYYITTHPEFFEKKKKYNCESTCSCFASWFDSCCSCCDCGCGPCGKIICCFVVWGIIIAFVIFSVLAQVLNEK